MSVRTATIASPAARLDARDDMMRAGSTDFGNFAADAVERATGADLALLNAGAFRLDDRVGPQITLRDLKETFLYDHAQAVIVVELDAGEVRVMAAHAQGKAGQGAFLQVSRGYETLSARGGLLRVALVRHMLVDDEDGFASLLASSRGCAAADLMAHVAVHDSGGLIDLVSRGAALGVAYSAANRLAGTRSDEKRLEDMLVRAVERYLSVCRSLGKEHAAMRILDFNPFDDPVPQEIAHERLLLRALVTQLAFLFGLEWLRKRYYHDLERSDLRYRRAVEYHNFLDKTMTFLDFTTRGSRLRDEEGCGEFADAALVVPDIQPRRASATILQDIGKVAELFTERLDEFLAVCRAHGMTDAECKQLVEADPRRAPLPKDLRNGRLDLRHLVLIILADLGFERVRTDLAAELQGRNGGDGNGVRYDDYLASALTYFDIVARYGLLVE